MADTIEMMVGQRLPARKRKRVIKSCFECHRRKRKCDRELPCGNCITRKREASCAYDASAPTSKAQDKKTMPLIASFGISPAANNILKGHTDDTVTHMNDIPTPSLMAAMLGYSYTRPSTLTLLQIIETVDQPPHSIGGGDLRYHNMTRGDLAPVRAEYKDLVRQLPAKTYIDQLVSIYFDGLHHQYSLIDQQTFYTQLAEWNQLPFQLLWSPENLRPEMQFFPALLFQVLATALLLLPHEGEADPYFDSLKYMGGMTLEDLAAEYSESGAVIVRVLGNSALDEVAIQAQFTRALFQKHTANVMECWHGIVAAVRDAQNLGMHRDSLDPKPEDSSVESLLKNQWRILHRRRMYMMLVTWIIYMSVILGYPCNAILSHGLPSLPADVPSPSDGLRKPIESRDKAFHPPTLITLQLFLFKVSDIMRYILDLGLEGSHPKDFSSVDHVHQLINTLHHEKPVVFCAENPDRRWDEHPECSRWIRNARLYLKQLHCFGILALHRPYISHRKKSRLAALSAAISMLGVQQKLFDGLPLTKCRGFQLFFGSFDAVVVIAYITILFPSENLTLRDCAVGRLHWAFAKLEASRDHNIVVRATQYMLNTLQLRFNEAVGSESSRSCPNWVVVPPSREMCTAKQIQANAQVGPAMSSDSRVSFDNLSLGIGPWINAEEPGVQSSSIYSVSGWHLPKDAELTLAPVNSTLEPFFANSGAGQIGTDLSVCTMHLASVQQSFSDDARLSCRLEGRFATHSMS